MALTSSELFSAVADALKVGTPDDLPAHWRGIVERARTAAYQTVLGELLARGFTLEQVLSFDRLEEYERAIGMFLALLDGGAYAGYDRESLKAMDRRPELKTVLVFIGGVWVKPVGDQPGLVTSGGSVQQDSAFGAHVPPNHVTDEYIDW